MVVIVGSITKTITTTKKIENIKKNIKAHFNPSDSIADFDVPFVISIQSNLLPKQRHIAAWLLPPPEPAEPL